MQGGCVCGAIRYEISGPVESLGHRHCSKCRKAHGTGFSTYLASKAPWVSIDDALPQHDAYPEELG